MALLKLQVKRHMIIGVDGNEANVSSKVGVSVYAFELLKHFAKRANAETEFRVFLRMKPHDQMPKESTYYKYEVVSGRILWSHVFLPIHLFFNSKINIFFAPAHYSPRFLTVPLVVTIHDLSYFYFPQEFLRKDLYKLRNWTSFSINRAVKIISVSKTTKKDVLTWYHVQNEKIRVIYNGFRKRKTEKNAKLTLNKYSLKKKKYILYVGTLQPRKNIPTLILAFAEFRNQHSDYTLVITGKKGWMFDTIYDAVVTHGIEDSVVFTGFATDEELVVLYEHASCFVMPSLYEGFGIPLLEAMAHSCPVLSSHASCLPEIGGDACLYFDPQNASELTEKLERICLDTQLQRSLVKNGLSRVKEFSWKACAEETLKVIQEEVPSV